MKRLVLLGVLALALICGTEQKASAWVNFKFGVGLNTEFSCGNNNLLWGLHKSGGYQGDAFGQGGCSGPGCMHGQHHMHGQHYSSFLGEAFTAPAPSSPASVQPQAYMPQYAPYQNVNYGYYSAPAYYYSPTWYGR